MNKFLEMMKKPNGRYSVAVICCTITMLLWWLSWIYCILTKTTFAHFDTCTIANWAIFTVVVLRNSIETKFFTIKVSDKNESSN